jgi:hypothetical protein
MATLDSSAFFFLVSRTEPGLWYTRDRLTNIGDFICLRTKLYEYFNRKVIVKVSALTPYQTCFGGLLGADHAFVLLFDKHRGRRGIIFG